MRSCFPMLGDSEHSDASIVVEIDPLVEKLNRIDILGGPLFQWKLVVDRRRDRRNRQSKAGRQNPRKPSLGLRRFAELLQLLVSGLFRKQERRSLTDVAIFTLCCFEKGSARDRDRLQPEESADGCVANLSVLVSQPS